MNPLEQRPIVGTACCFRGNSQPVSLATDTTQEINKKRLTVNLLISPLFQCIYKLLNVCDELENTRHLLY